jgi:hypothetical protein
VNHVAKLGMFAFVLFPAGLNADGGDDALTKQKAAAEATWKKMEFGKDAAPLVETPNLLVYSRLPEAKTKALLTSLDKIMPLALKALKYDAMDRPWAGKLTVYILPDRGDFVEFMRKIIRKSPGEDDLSYSSVSGDDAMMAIGAPRSGMEDPEELAHLELANVLLRKKLGGAEPPAWLVTGFAHASAHRAINKTAKAASAPRLAFKELWNETLPPQQKANAATYFVDYLAYGPVSEVFPDFVTALRPGENGAMPMPKDVYDAIKMDERTLEYYARNWKKPPTPKTPTKPKDKPKSDQ